MKLIFKQKILSFLDSYKVYDENDNVYFEIKGKLSFGKLFKIYNSNNEEIGTLKRNLFTFLPTYSIYKGEEKLGEIKKKFTFLKPKFELSFNNYTVEGNFFEWDYEVKQNDIVIASISKEFFHFTDTYVINVDESDALIVLMIVLAIDAIKDERDNNND